MSVYFMLLVGFCTYTYIWHFHNKMKCLNLITLKCIKLYFTKKSEKKSESIKCVALVLI